MTFVLFGHSFVKRLRNRRQCTLKVELERATIPVTCLGEGGLTLSRIRSNPGYYLRQIGRAKPSILIFDLGTNDLCSKDIEPLELLASLRSFVNAFPSWNINPDVLIFLPVLPRTGNMRGNQVTLDQFNQKAETFNELLEDITFLEDRWFVWRHRGLKHPRYNLDGVHLTKIGMCHYERTLKQLVKFFEARCW